MVRVIGHIDFDYFFAQVEEVQDPTLKGRPVIVCVFSGRTEDSGVVSTANYKAREYGVTSGMPIVLAKKKLEDVDPAVIRMKHEKYEAVSDRIMRLVEEQVDILEQAGIDEAFFDLTQLSRGDYEAARRTAEGLKRSILEAENLVCSVGLGRSKAVAKLASDMAKPGGLMVVSPDSTAAFLDPIPVNRLYGVGPKTTSVLRGIGVETVGQLSLTDAVGLENLVGKKLSAYLLAASEGSDDQPVVGGLGPTQFSRIVTLKRDTRDTNEILAQLSQGIDYLQDRLSASGKSFRTLSALGILTDLSLHTKSRTLENPVKDSAVLRKCATELFSELCRSVNGDFRRAGIRVSELTSIENQSSLNEFTA